ncbi:MAG: phosphate ABC transporter substrate-binding protein PstS [Chamaesiphon sp.]
MSFQLRSNRQIFLFPLVALSLSLSGCPSQNTTTTTTTSSSSTSSTSSTSGGGANISLSGAGATFPAPLYSRWFSEYNKLHSDIQVSYQPVGSGAGIEQFTKGTVDFGASDVAMKDEEIAKVPKSKGVVLLPMTAGAIVIGYNLPNVKNLKLSQAVSADIFLGKIKTWNDPQITAINPGVNLPNKPITVVHRSDGSGTTAVFTNYLSAVSPAWKSGPGTGKTVNWPVGVGAKGNEGISAQLLQTEGTIGYTEYGYAKQQNIATANLQNKAGKYVEPTLESAAKTLSAVTLPANLRAFIVNPEGADSYPIVTYTWILASQNYDKPDKAKALKDVLKWALTDGQKYSSEVGYIPLPQNVVTKVQAAVDTIKP